MGFINDLFGAKNEQWAQPINLTKSVQGNANADLVNTRQTALADALTNAMQGKGPSIAQDQLNKATSQTLNQGAGAIASQKGINPALQAKMILDNQQKTLADTAQNSSLLRNQEMQQATGQLGSALSNQRGQDIQQQQAQNQAIASQNAAFTQAQLGTEGINANIGAGNAGQNAKTGGGVLSGIGGLLGLAEGGDVPEIPEINTPAISMPDTTATGNAATNAGGIFGGVTGEKKEGGGGGMGEIVGKILPMLLGGMAEGGTVPEEEKRKPLIDLGGMLRSGVQSLFGGAAPAAPAAPGLTSQDYANMYGAPSATEKSNVMTGGPMTSYDHATMMGAPGGAGGGLPAVPLKGGGKVPGRAKVQGDSEENDKVLALLSPGEVVIPRSAAGDPKMEKEFLAQLHKSREKKGKGGYSKVIQAQQQLNDRLMNLEKMAYGGVAC